MENVESLGDRFADWILSEFDGLEYIYETDSANNGDLPKEIWADVIIVGNKWKNITVDTVKERIPKGTNPVIVII